MKLNIYIPTALNDRHTPILAQLLVSDPGQQRSLLTQNPVLSLVAQRRADDMATRNYFSHVDPDGYGPNYHARQAGYKLHHTYAKGDQDNNIESIGGGKEQPTDVWAVWLSSPGHRVHVLGEIDFYRKQTEFGVGYAHNPEATYVHYWVVLIARPGS